MNKVKVSDKISFFNYNLNKLSLNEGNTELEKYVLSKRQILYIKREDKNPFGSWKDRISSVKVWYLKNQNIKKGVIATSGNAGISYLNYFKHFIPDFELVILISSKINNNKLEILKNLIKDTKNQIIQTNEPQKLISKYTKNGYYNLKSSIDNDATKAYWNIAYELKQLFAKKEKSSVKIFCPVSSGTAFVGISEGIHLIVQDEYSMPTMYAVQTSSNHPLIENNYFNKEEQSLADAIYDPKCLRSYQIKKIVDNTQGKIVVVSNQDLRLAQSFYSEISKNKEKISYNSLVSLAGFLLENNKKIKENRDLEKNIVIFSGL